MFNGQVVILAGGRGTRLGDLTSKIPKSMMEVNGTPFLELLIKLLKKNGFNKYLLLVGYLSEIIKNYFENGSRFNVSIKYSPEKISLGTAGSLINAKEFLDDEFLLINGDTYLPINYTNFIKNASSQSSLCTIACYDGPLFNDTKFNLYLNHDGKIEEYSKSKPNPTFNAVDAGVYFVKKNILKNIVTKVSSLENDIFPILISKDQLTGLEINEKFYDIGTLSRLQEFRSHDD